MSTQTQEALKMAIEALERAAEYLAGDDKYDVYNLDKAYFACKEALAQPAQEPSKSKVNKYLGLVDLEGEFPLTEWERKEIIKYSMECLLEEGELGKLGMLCHKFEETIRYFENKNPVKEFIKNKELYTHHAPSWQGLTAQEIASIPLNEYTVQTVEKLLKRKNNG